MPRVESSCSTTRAGSTGCVKLGQPVPDSNFVKGFSIDQMIESGDYVISRYTATGTHKGDLAGIPPTGRHAETHGCVVAEIKNGRILRQWLYWDSAHLLRQLGVLPGA
jgi:predicted ester cyclase